ncbi:alpha/beta fold hydrolase [Thalassotalea psychrophila]|uniref:Alpha/beta fold hydrolase n=1 Tax=Thalassotalea psychrophila TaxID=3065647 RepID=A0ABY9TPG6_9GAMM|nr:alpha/beta fold hydrolase [Colwelliaceae bacterium SQ149]
MSTNKSTTTPQILPLLNHVIRGEGEPLILIHGLFGSLENLNMVAKALANNFKVISVDVRNHGGSLHHKSMNYGEMSNDIFALLDHLNINTCDILGHSMGGKIAMQCALSKPERINKLIVADIAPVEYPPHHNEIIAGLLSINISDISNRQDADKQLAGYVAEPGVRQFLLKNLVKAESGFTWRANIKDIANDYKSIAQGFSLNQQFNGPTLFIKGGNSNYITSKHQTVISTLFPHAKAKIIQGAGHWLHAEKTIAFNKIVNDFLSS